MQSSSNNQVFRAIGVLIACVFLAAVGASLSGDVALGAADESDARQRGEPTRTVLWISVDGVLPDYLDRTETPMFDRLSREGAYTRKLAPVFPSLTFPSHVSQATGAKVADHGIPSNSFIDRSDWRIHRYPWDSQMLEAEPIWLTAARQDIRVAVYDWPLSHSQRGEVTAEHFGQRYIRGLSDAERLEILLDTWEEDQNESQRDRLQREPLRLLMGYIVGPDSLGHRDGPDGAGPVEAMRESDALIGRVIERAVGLWEEQRRRVNEELYVIISTDHGMSEVHTLVHLGYLAGIEDADDVETMTSGNIGHVFIRDDGDDENEQTEDQRKEHIEAIVEHIDAHEFARAWTQDDLPEHWKYTHESRIGDIVVVLDKGYTFSRRPDGVTGDAKEHGGPLGMHGYDPRENPEMNGYLVIWRHPEPLGGIDLGEVHSLQLHATVAELLGIEPAEGAHKEAFSFEPKE